MRLKETPPDNWDDGRNDDGPDRMRMAEAINAGKRAAIYLESIKETIGQAGKLGAFDILGGGFLTSYAKRIKMQDFNRELETARQAVHEFEQQLDGVKVPEIKKVSMSRNLVRRDLSGDSILGDLLVQHGIEKTKQQIDEAIEAINQIVEMIEKRLGQ
ncbi:MAG: hypothetical protein NC124_01015 [Clostridium sp.]|nr:hypothetical protein [Clostridium sp.]